MPPQEPDMEPPHQNHHFPTSPQFLELKCRESQGMTFRVTTFPDIQSIFLSSFTTCLESKRGYFIWISYRISAFHPEPTMLQLPDIVIYFWDRWLWMLFLVMPRYGVVPRHHHRRRGPGRARGRLLWRQIQGRQACPRTIRLRWLQGKRTFPARFVR